MQAHLIYRILLHQTSSSFPQNTVGVTHAIMHFILNILMADFLKRALALLIMRIAFLGNPRRGRRDGCIPRRNRDSAETLESC